MGELCACTILLVVGRTKVVTAKANKHERKESRIFFCFYAFRNCYQYLIISDWSNAEKGRKTIHNYKENCKSVA